jgi:phosphoribosylformimino-5-aminoimidazole carboxamide ribotide isomerase
VEDIMCCRVVPAIDLIDGKCVRLQRGDFATVEVVGEDPIAVAMSFREEGFRRLHVVDLSGARDGTPRHLDIVRDIVKATDLEVDYSGGVRRDEHVERIFESGVRYVVVGSAAIKQRDDVRMWIEGYGPDRFIFGLDVLDGTVRVSGWCEDSGISLEAALENLRQLKVSRVMSTDIKKDGLLTGPSVELYRELGARHPDLFIIASGGVTTAEDIRQLSSVGVREVIIGKAFYSGRINSSEISEFIW